MTDDDRKAIDDAETGGWNDGFEAGRIAGMEQAAVIAEEAMILLSIIGPGVGPFTRQDRAVDEARAAIATAIRAMLDGVEPVAVHIHTCGEQTHLYSLDALKEAIDHETA